MWQSPGLKSLPGQESRELLRLLFRGISEISFLVLRAMGSGVLVNVRNKIWRWEEPSFVVVANYLGVNTLSSIVHCKLPMGGSAFPESSHDSHESGRADSRALWAESLGSEPHASHYLTFIMRRRQNLFDGNEGFKVMQDRLHPPS